MPIFADLLSERLRAAHPHAALALLGRYGISRGVIDTIRKKMENRWHNLPAPVPVGSIIGSDGSFINYQLRDGSILLINRAIALGLGKEKREIDMGIVFGNSTDINFFQGHLSQFLEIRATYKLIEELKPEYALLDGSLMTLFTNLPFDIPIRTLDRHSPLKFSSFAFPASGLPINLTLEVGKLIRIAKNSGTTLIGVSKDSNASYLENLILDPSIYNQIKLLELPFEASNKLNSAYESFLRNPMATIAQFKKIGLKNKMQDDPEWHRLMDILSFRLSATSDCAMLSLMVPNTGFSTPLELSATPQQERIWKRSPTDFLKRNFYQTIGDIPVEFRDQFEEAILNAIKEINKFDTIITTYIHFENNGRPIRLDLIASDAGYTGRAFINAEDPHFVEITPEVEKAIAIAHGSYVNDKIHNTLLWEADEIVKMRRGDTGVVYLDILEQETGLSRFEFLSRREIREW
ncbi:MAG: DNA double-strand break repair nuclease NurA [Promethearchaeota archaeon]